MRRRCRLPDAAFVEESSRSECWIRHIRLRMRIRIRKSTSDTTSATGISPRIILLSKTGYNTCK
jgi:hypothetical protein